MTPISVSAFSPTQLSDNQKEYNINYFQVHTIELVVYPGLAMVLQSLFSAIIKCNNWFLAFSDLICHCV